MTPFLQLRMWARRAPAGERALVAVVGVVLLALVAWALAPVGSPTSSLTATSSGDQPLPGQGSNLPGGGGSLARGPRLAGATATLQGGAGAGVGPTGGTVVGPGGPRLPSQGTAPVTGTADACGPRTSTDQGVTATQVHVDVTIPALAGQAGNSLVGLPSAAQQQQMWQAALAQANKEGGIRCRTIVAKYYQANPLDQQSLQALCLDIVADKPFALLDEGLSSPVGSPTPRDCPPSHQIPSFGSASLGLKEIASFSPYLFSYFPAAERTVHNAVLGAHQLGWFTGAKVVGLLEQECNPDLNTIALRDLAAFGFSGGKLQTFDFGCQNGIPSAQDLSSAVLRFRQAGVTHVFDDSGVYENFFSRTAAAQQYKPKYAVGDQATIALWDNPNFGPDPQNFDGGLAITGTRYGEQDTSGLRPNAATQHCDAAMRAMGQPSSWTSPDGYAGVVCATLTMLVDAANHAPQLERSLLAQGLQGLGTVQLPFPAGPASFGLQQGQVGGGFWRAATYRQACRCFQVTRVPFTPDFR